MKVTIEFELPDGQEVPKVEDIITLTSPDWFIDKWHIQDVQANNYHLTDDQAREVIELMYKHHDCTVGVNWEFINTLVDEHFINPEETEE
jgi:hypothetical protein